MRSNVFARIAAIAALGAAGSASLVAQSASVVASPNALSFSVSGGAVAPAQHLVNISLSTGQAAVPFQLTTTPGVTATPELDPFTLLPNRLRVTIDPATIASVSGPHNVVISDTGNNAFFLPLTIPVTVTGSNNNAPLGASPSSVNFVRNGANIPGPITLSIFSNTGQLPTYTPTVAIHSGSSNWLSVSPSTASNSPTLTLTPNTAGLANGVYTATVTLNAPGVPAVSIPVTLSINQSTGGTPLTVNPSSLTFSAQSTSQVVTISSATAASFNVSLSGNLADYVQVSTVQVTPTSSQIQVSVPNLQQVPAGTTGSLVLTPIGSTTYAVTTVPITINPVGSSTTLIVNPTTLTFTGVVGSTATIPPQVINVVSSDLTQRQFQVTASSTANFLVINNNFLTTPSTVSIGINMANITQPGTYQGALFFTPLTGGGSTTSVQVTLNVIQSIVVTPDQTQLTLTSGAGAAAVQRNVLLSSSVPNIPFTATATTTTGTPGWLSVSSQSATLPATIAIVANPAQLAVGTYTGSVAITAQGVTVATISVTFTVTAAATLQLSPGTLVFNYETSAASNPSPQSVQVTSSGTNSLTWNAAIVSSSPWLEINPSTGSTPGTFNVAVVPTGLSPGTYTGTVRVTSTGASNSPQTLNVTLNVTTPATPLITSFQNGGSFEQMLAVPGAIITIRGSDLGPVTGVSGQITGQNLATTVSDVEVTFDGIPAPIIYASATQINAVVPFEVYGRTTTRLQVRYRSQRSRELELRVQDTAPGLFTSNATGSGQVAALNQNGSLNSAQNPEQRGNIVVLYGTGQGQSNPGGMTGRIMGTDLRRPIANVSVRIGGQNAEVLYAGSAPGLVAGALQINVRIPSNSIIGPSVPVQVQIGNQTSQANATIAVQ